MYNNNDDDTVKPSADIQPNENGKSLLNWKKLMTCTLYETLNCSIQFRKKKCTKNRRRTKKFKVKMLRSNQWNHKQPRPRHIWCGFIWNAPIIINSMYTIFFFRFCTFLWGNRRQHWKSKIHTIMLMYIKWNTFGVVSITLIKITSGYIWQRPRLYHWHRSTKFVSHIQTA